MSRHAPSPASSDDPSHDPDDAPEMTTQPHPHDPVEMTSEEDAAVERIVAAGPAGAFAVAGVATAIVMSIYFAFYLLAYLPRGAVQ